MNAPHVVEITKNTSTTYLATEGKFCDRNIAVQVTIDETPILEAGIEMGKAQAEYNAWNSFWDAYQNYGNRTDYTAAFRGEGWNNTTYKPKYSLQPVSASNMYNNSAISGRVEVDTSVCTDITSMFANSKSITSIGTIDTSYISSIAGVFALMSNLENIDLLILKGDGSQTFSDTCFLGNTKLKEIRINGVIGNSLNMNQCHALSKESVTSIINALDKSAQGKTLTLSQFARKYLTDEEWSTLTGKKSNWTIKLV